MKDREKDREHMEKDMEKDRARRMGDRFCETLHIFCVGEDRDLRARIGKR